MQEGPNRFISCRAAIKQLLARQKLSRWIKNLWRSYRDKFQKVSMDKKCNKIFPEKKSKGLDRYLSVEICLEVVVLDKKKKKSKRGKTQRSECNQASYLTKDPSNMLSSQKHLSIRKCKAFIDPKHTHTKQV